MLALELVVILGVSLLIASVVSRRYGIAPPLVLLAIGLLLGFAPPLRAAHIPPEAVLLIFLPALLYWESLNISLREIRSNLRPIALVSSGLVVATAAAVAAVAHAMGVPWGPAWILGAALAPTDATAVASLVDHLPRRNLTVLRAESLVNDGTALVLYALAVGVTAGEQHLGTLNVTGLFALSYVGGAVAGLVLGFVASQVQRRLAEPMQQTITSIVTPFAAFLAAEAIHASGVLSVVVCGLFMSRTGPRIGRAQARQLVGDFFSLSTFLLNGSLFVLIGLEAQSAARDLDTVDVGRAIVLVLAVAGTVLAARFAWLFTTPYVIRMLDRRPQQRLRRATARARVVSAVVGFRGAVSLAAALAVPRTVHGGGPFPDRDLIVFVTAGVIVLTLAQSLVAPSVIRWAHMPPDTVTDEERHLAERVAVTEAIDSLPEMATRVEAGDAARDRVDHELRKHLRVLEADGSGDDDERIQRYEHDYTALRLATIGHKRATVLRLHDERRIDDAVVLQMQQVLDREEIRLNAASDQVH